MDDGGPMGNRNWDFFDPMPMKGSLGLQLMSTVAAAAESKPALVPGPGASGGSVFPFHHQHHPRHHHRNAFLEPSGAPPMDFLRDAPWMHHGHYGSLLHDAHPSHLPPHAMMHSDQANHLPPPPEDNVDLDDHHHHDQQHHVEPVNEPPLLPKRMRGQQHAKSPKPKQKKARKRPAPPPPSAPAADNSEPAGAAGGRRRAGRKSMDIVINGIDMDLARIPPPVCTCTGAPHQCYRWGVGGWQSACCTTTTSEYPLPMSTKRRGARIAGRKMSLGAFKKVLEKLAGEGYHFANPIDLRTFWAKHGTNKFVTIR